VTVIVKTKIGT